jgi:hypothetical protein
MHLFDPIAHGQSRTTSRQLFANPRLTGKRPGAAEPGALKYFKIIMNSISNPVNVASKSIVNILTNFPEKSGASKVILPPELVIGEIFWVALAD